MLTGCSVGGNGAPLCAAGFLVALDRMDLELRECRQHHQSEVPTTAQG
jgi:hypothetical protein